MASSSTRRGSNGPRSASARLMRMLSLLLFSLVCLVAHAAEEDAAAAAGDNNENSTSSAPHSGNGAAATAHADDGGSSSAELEHQEIEPAYAVLMPCFVVVVGVVVAYLLTRYVHFIPYTAVLFVIGVVMGVGSVLRPFQDSSLDQLTISIGQWADIDHEVLFLVFLPGLLFKDAFEINFHLFVASFWQLIILAFPMVLAGTMLTALIGYYIFPYGWSWNQCFTFGSILAATDPVAVSALLNEVGAPPRLKMHISGESLLNDGSAVVFYTVFSGLFLAELDIGLGEESSVGEAFATFFRMSLGGFSVGLAFGIGLVVILFLFDRRYEQEETVLQVASTAAMAYLSFYTSEIVCHMSGVIAVVTCGIVTKAFGDGLISDWKVMESFWILLEFLLNTVIFALGGIEFGVIVADPNRGWQGKDWGYLFLLYILANAIRFFLLYLFFPVNARIGLKTNWKETFFSAWGGLRVSQYHHTTTTKISHPGRSS